MTITMKRLLNLYIILTICLFSAKVSAAAERSEDGEKGKYIQFALNADSLNEQMDKMENEEKRWKNQQRADEQREKQFKKIMSQITSKWSKAGLKFHDRESMNGNTRHFSFDCCPRYADMTENESLYFESSTDSLKVRGISIIWDEVVDKKGGINLHRIEEESRSAIAAAFKLPVDTSLQDIVATQTSLSYEAKKKVQISKSYFNEFRQKLENATEKALTKIASKTKMKFYPVSQANAENFSNAHMEDRRKMAKFFSYRLSYEELYSCTGEITDPTVFIIIKAKFGRKGDYIRIELDGIGRNTRIERILSNRHRPYYFDLSISTKEETEAHVEAGIADAIGSIIEDGQDIIIEK